MEDKLVSYGGQAVIEGVMMRGRHAVAIAMRAPDGEIVTHVEKLGGIYQSPIKKLPFLRGLILLWDAMVLGTRALTLSANVQTDEDEKLEGPALYLTVGFSLLLGIGLFFLLPTGVVILLENLSRRAAAGTAAFSPFVANLIEGLIRLALLVLYVWAIGFAEDIRRVFGYHGAEHKTINAYEAGAELTPENVARYSLEHPRCGTAFLLTLVVFSVLLYSLLPPLTPFWRLTSRLLLLPVLAGIAYEYIRWTADHLDSPWVQALIRPNLALQHLTTREPDLDMLAVGIAAFKAMRAADVPPAEETA